MVLGGVLGRVLGRVLGGYWKSMTTGEQSALQPKLALLVESDSTLTAMDCQPKQ